MSIISQLLLIRLNNVKISIPIAGVSRSVGQVVVAVSEWIACVVVKGLLIVIDGMGFELFGFNFRDLD